MSEQRDYLKSVLDQLTVKNNAQPDPGRFMSEFSRIYSQIDKKHLNDDLDVFYKNFSTYDQAIETFFEQLRHAGSIGKDEVKDQNGCLLYDLTREVNFNAFKLDQFLIELNKDIIRLASLRFSSHFSNLHHSRRVLLDFVLKSAWPTVHNGVLKDHIQEQLPTPGEYKEDEMALALFNARQALLKTGDKNFVYGILAIKPVKDNYKFFFEGLENYCSARYEEDRIHGFDTVIARMPFNHSVYTEKYANLWRMKQLNKEKKNIETIIAREMEYVSLFFSMMIENCRNLYLEPSLPQIADTLKNKFGPDFISEDKFHDNA
uniref:NR LBD domain-containing protein n=1 Tax=Caenorhabditis tropicalis TaxID=1561998 RepID=A0A1I7THG6_9PELO